MAALIASGAGKGLAEVVGGGTGMTIRKALGNDRPSSFDAGKGKL